MFVKIVLIALILLNLHAEDILEEVYYVDKKNITFASIVPDTKNDFHIVTIDSSRYSQKIKAKDLIKLLDKHGYKNYSSKSNYINFVLKSPIDTSYIEQKIKDYYEKKYENIEIKTVFIKPRGYITSLPENYIVNIRNNDFLSSNGTINIKTKENKKVFFDYYITANVEIYISKDIIKKETHLSPLNCTKKSVQLDSFRDKPLQNIETASLQAKRHIPKDMILTLRDIEVLDVVKRDSMININLYKDGIAITFSAKALQDGKVNDIINVQNSSGKILKAKVTSSNTAEIE
ncbi:flagellar basal body P-ring formation chaperone FlgA [Sulfurimonas sp.]|uniref:flagellar basal body P-ring formation chaperone FlgA n=1 Tax=Sulfurimonas sp. TaxID=2022749 RepID=UPI00286EB1FB|nr:flagellar basal body P-ring formation chaperone FlgA [Sulfurimonas sp.]